MRPKLVAIKVSGGHLIPVIMEASSRGRRRRDFEASIIIRATIAVGSSRPGCTGPLSFPGFDVGVAVRGALEDAGRGADRRFRRLQDRLAGGSGPGGEAWPRSPESGSSAGVIQVLPAAHPAADHPPPAAHGLVVRPAS